MAIVGSGAEGERNRARKREEKRGEERGGEASLSRCAWIRMEVVVVTRARGGHTAA